MKSRLLLIMFLFSFMSYGQGITPDVMLMKAAADFSKYEPGIGIFIIAGNEYDSQSDSKIQQSFEKIFKEKEINVKVFVQRTDIRNGSTYDLFSLGAGVYDTVTFSNLSAALKEAVNHYNSFNGKVEISKKYRKEFEKKKEEYEKNKIKN
ncbi:hypothetical protein N1F78_01080 [Seonamhaeicola sp. MEBiC1930]|uniref:hypothetical protein n=1 Tax=Seonamhaeicola sp. MEBiC01930 TaxID=2976768 RepID=UPI003246423C